MAQLVFEDSLLGGTRSVAIGPDTGPVMVGRHRGCQIRLNADDVSRMHARIEYQNGAYLLVDLGSAAGTFVDQERIQKHWLTDGDRVLCGSSEICFQFSDDERPAKRRFRPAEPASVPPPQPAAAAPKQWRNIQRPSPAAPPPPRPAPAPKPPSAPAPAPSAPAPLPAPARGPVAVSPGVPSQLVVPRLPPAELSWEEVPADDEVPVERAKIPGGWLVRTRWPGSLRGGMALTFVPDPYHAWELP